jgi:hypothetical protein
MVFKTHILYFFAHPKCTDRWKKIGLKGLTFNGSLKGWNGPGFLLLSGKHRVEKKWLRKKKKSITFLFSSGKSTVGW